jgi:hypothetical protein
VQNLVSQLALAHGFSFVYDATLIGHELFEIVSEALHFIVVRYGIRDKDHLVLSISKQNHPPRTLPIANCPIANWFWSRIINFTIVPIGNRAIGKVSYSLPSLSARHP